MQLGEESKCRLREREVKILFLIESFHLKKSFLACLLPPKKARPTFPYLVRDLS